MMEEYPLNRDHSGRLIQRYLSCCKHREPEMAVGGQEAGLAVGEVNTDGVRVIDGDHGRDESEDQQGKEDNRHHNGNLLLHEVLPNALPVGVVGVTGALSILGTVLSKLEQLLLGHAEAILHVHDAAGIRLLGVGIDHAAIDVQLDSALVFVRAVGADALGSRGIDRQLRLHLNIG